MHWQEHAACRGEDPELFFPASTSGPDHERQIRAAKAVCELCTVRFECLQDAMGRHAQDGIWGGMTDVERKRLALSHGTRPRQLA